MTSSPPTLPSTHHWLLDNILLVRKLLAYETEGALHYCLNILPTCARYHAKEHENLHRKKIHPLSLHINLLHPLTHVPWKTDGLGLVSMCVKHKSRAVFSKILHMYKFHTWYIKETHSVVLLEIHRLRATVVTIEASLLRGQ
jgi:hypothetical protein